MRNIIAKFGFLSRKNNNIIITKSAIFAFQSAKVAL